MTLLDHSGNRTTKILKPEAGKWIIDGEIAKTIYYLIE